MEPKRGQIVDFFHPATAAGGHIVSPAVIHSGVGDTLLLCVLAPAGPRMQPGVTKGFAPNQWNFQDAQKPEEAPVVPVKLPSVSGNEAA